MATYAVNPQTGERMQLVGGEWQPVGGPRQAAPAAPAGTGGVGVMEGLLVGAGDTLNSGKLNLQDLYYSATGNDAGQRRIAGERMEADKVRASLGADAPVSSAIGQMLPSLATMPLGMGIGGAASTGLRMLAGQAALGAGTNALTGSSGDLAGDAAEGGAWGAGAPVGMNLLGRVLNAGKLLSASRRARVSSMVPEGAGGGGSGAGGGGALNGPAAGRPGGSNLTAGELEVLAGADRVGMRVLPGQRLGDGPLRQLEASVASTPGFNREFLNLERANDATVNRLTAAAMGEVADSITPEVRARAATKIGGQMREVAEGIGQVDISKTIKGLQEMVADETVSARPRGKVAKLLSEVEAGVKGREAAAEGAGNVLTAQNLMDWRSDMTKEMRAAFAAGKPANGKMYAQTIELIDNAIEDAAIKSGRADLTEKYDKAREAWTVLRAADRGGVGPDGSVLPGQMFRLLRQSNKAATWGLADDVGATTIRRGTGIPGEDAFGEVLDALRYRTSRIGRPIVGNSGTVERGAVGRWLQGDSLSALAASTAAGAARRASVAPLLKGYTSMDPERAAVLQQVYEQAQSNALGAVSENAAGGLARGILGGL